MRTTFRMMLGLGLALGVPAAAGYAQPAPPAGGFGSLWTGWRDVNAEALAKERAEAEEVREDYVTASSSRRDQLRNQGRALGERVGEIVRVGDCEEGERVAREAGDFALVQAVRDHCRGGELSPR